MAEKTLADIVALPTGTSSRIIDFEKAEVRPGFRPDTYFLIVSGLAPCANMEVSLNPLIYIRQPEYWGIEVVGTLRGGICLPATKDYLVTLDISNVLGTEGIEVVGASRSEQIPVGGKSS
jgi:hypothetical protein